MFRHLARVETDNAIWMPAIRIPCPQHAEEEKMSRTGTREPVAFLKMSVRLIFCMFFFVSKHRFSALVNESPDR